MKKSSYSVFYCLLKSDLKVEADFEFSLWALLPNSFSLCGFQNMLKIAKQFSFCQLFKFYSKTFFRDDLVKILKMFHQNSEIVSQASWRNYQQEKTKTCLELKKNEITKTCQSHSQSLFHH